jgi:uncharacterized protein (DUF1501 family)
MPYRSARCSGTEIDTQAPTMSPSTSRFVAVTLPNENYARELMELFALGRNNGYTETDVHNAAIALSGYWVDGDNDDEVFFDEERGPQRAVRLFDRNVRSAADVVDAVCDHPACAAHIAGHLYHALHGVEPSDDLRAELATVFADSGLEARGLADRVLMATISEFGRTVGENGSSGLDHGGASSMLVMGPVEPGMYGELPSLDGLDPEEGLPASIPFDSYLGTLAEQWFDVPASDIVEASATAGILPIRSL